MEQRTTKKPVENCVSLTSPATQNGSCEERKYELRMEKAMVNKLNATDRPDVEVEMTGGGLRMLWSAGMYELIKMAADEYFLRDDIGGKKTIAKDKVGNVVEVKYKVPVDQSKHIHYCLNMYHTRSSCLINGKGLSTFVQTDIQQLLQLVQNKLSMENSSVSQVNSCIRTLISQYFGTNGPDLTAESKDAECNSVHIRNSLVINCERESENIPPENTSEVPVVVNPGVVYPVVECEIQTDVVQTSREIACQTDSPCVDRYTQTDETDQNVLIRKLYAMYEKLDQKLEGFILESRQGFGQLKKDIASLETNSIQETRQEYSNIKDEICTIKKAVTLSSCRIQESIEENVARYNEKLSSDIENKVEILRRKIQGIQDHIKTIDINTCTDKRDLKPSSRKSTTEEEPIDLTKQRDQIKQQTSPRSTTYQPHTNRTPTTITQRKNTLIIGDSILKGIHTRGLNRSTYVKTMSGKRIHDVCEELNDRLRDDVESVVIYIGGNDAASNNFDVYRDTRELEHLIINLKMQGIKVYLCTVAPRSDCDVSDLNDRYREISRNTSCRIIEMENAFVYGNGTVVRQYYHRDGIHHNVQGTRTLVSSINSVINITKVHTHDNTDDYRTGQYENRSNRQPRVACIYCGLFNHVSPDCRRRRHQW